MALIHHAFDGKASVKQHERADPAPVWRAGHTPFAFSFSVCTKTVINQASLIFGKRNSAKDVVELKVPKPGAFI